jgi:hypothetical protein
MNKTSKKRNISRSEDFERAAADSRAGRVPCCYCLGITTTLDRAVNPCAKHQKNPVLPKEKLK